MFILLYVYLRYWPSFVVSSHTHFAITHFIHANLYCIWSPPFHSVICIQIISLSYCILGFCHFIYFYGANVNVNANVTCRIVIVHPLKSRLETAVHCTVIESFWSSFDDDVSGRCGFLLNKCDTSIERRCVRTKITCGLHYCDKWYCNRNYNNESEQLVICDKPWRRSAAWSLKPAWL